MYLRGSANAALDEAVRRANEVGLPLVVYQGLNPDYPEANDRIHTFILECARDVAAELGRRGIPYRFHLRRSSGAVRRPVAAELAREAALVVVDDFPAFVRPRVTDGLLRRTSDSGVPVIAVDANGLVPLRTIADRQYAAYTLRPRLHRRIPEYLVPDPSPEPSVSSRPDLPVLDELFDDVAVADDGEIGNLVSECDIDHGVAPSTRFRGGRLEARARLAAFIERGLDRYAEDRSDPGDDGTSGLSPYLHFGCLSTTEIVREVLCAEAADESVDDFLEELVVRRELAYNFCVHTPAEEHGTLSPLPDWAKKTLAEHADDPRDSCYSDAALEEGATHDTLWNAAQAELVATGAFHGYLRMLWGKNVIRWTESCADAQAFMLRMHFRYSLDGRNPNTYANVLWCFGLHDRAFQEGPVLGKLRPLKSASTRRKFDIEPYMARVRTAVAETSPPQLEGVRLEDSSGSRRS
jgi:deoxyribodipyrimidine photo-lyase